MEFLSSQQHICGSWGLCMHSRLELNSHASTTVIWMFNLPHVVVHRIQSLVIGCGFLFEFTGIAAWDKTDPNRRMAQRVCQEVADEVHGVARGHTAFRIVTRILPGLGCQRSCIGYWRMELWMLFGSSWMAMYLRRTITSV